MGRCRHHVLTRTWAGCDNHRCHNKNPQIGNGNRDVNDVMPGSDGPGFLVMLNKSSELRFELRRSELSFGPGRGQSSLWTVRFARALVGLVSWELTMDEQSARVEKPKLKEGNKSFVPEPRESSVFRVFQIPRRMNILWTLWTFLLIRIFHVLIYDYVTHFLLHGIPFFASMDLKTFWRQK